MKTFKSMQVALAAALVALVGGCANEDLTTNLPGKNGKLVTISVGMPTDAKTRVAFDDANLLLKWQADDKLAISRNNDSREYTLNEGFEDEIEGKFTGEIVDEEGSGSYTVTYPANFTSMDGQRQTEDNNTDHLKDYIVLGATPDNLTDAFELEMKSSIMKFILTKLPTDIGTLKSLTWLTEGDSKNGRTFLDLTGCSATGDALTAYLSFLPEDMNIKANGKFTVLLAGDKTYRAEVTVTAGKTYDAGSRYEAAMDNWGEVIEQMQFTVSYQYNWYFRIPFPTSGTTPTDLTVDWGDGSEVTVVPKGTALTGDSDPFFHNYSSIGTYTITITSSQGDATQQQIPEFNFRKYGNDYWQTNTRITSVITPLLNMATSIEDCFSGCQYLTEIPAGVFDKQTAVTNFKGCFNNCQKLLEIPAGFFDKYTEITDFSSCFASCYAITKIPEGLFDKNTAATNFSSCFSGCNKMTEIPAGLFDKNTAATNFSSCFSGCNKMTEIPAGLFDKNTAATNFSSCFSSWKITEIPEGIFAKRTEATDFSNCFNYCQALTEIPARLFANNTKVTNFSGCFGYCSSLTQIPAGLFANNTTVTNFSGCFNSCKALTEIPEELFVNNTAATNFSQCFENCKNLTEIPAKLFYNNTAVTGFYSCFNGLTITEIPAGLFDKNTAVTDFNSCFSSCQALTKIPAELFYNNTAVTSFQDCFFNCKALTEIPAGLFDKNTAVTNFYRSFAECVNLKLNDKIFSLTADKQNRFKDLNTNFGMCFYNVGTSLTEAEVLDSTAPDLWNYARGASASGWQCFKDCKVKNSADIPIEWQK